MPDYLRLLMIVGALCLGITTGAPAAAVDPDAIASARELALLRAQDARVSAMAKRAEVEANRWDGVEPQPFRAHDKRTGETTLVLPNRGRVFTLGELIPRFPETFAIIAPDTLLLKEHLLIGHDAALVMAEPGLREVRLQSDAQGFVTIVCFRGDLTITSEHRALLDVTTWDAAVAGPDRDMNDGRAYVLTRGGRMDVDRIDFSHLGFLIGRSSGVAWMGWPDEPATGNATDSRFRDSYFGAFTFEAVDMVWRGNIFSNNVIYGFDPHDHSDRFVVESNVAYGNGRHGFIFSRGCLDNVMRFNLAFGNTWHGFVLDDGMVAADGTIRHMIAVPSDDNVIEYNVAWGNGQVGVALEGGTRNLVRRNLIVGNRFGIRLKDDASGNIVANNVIRTSEVFGIYLYNNSAANLVADNTLDGGQTGIAVKGAIANRLLRNSITGVSSHGLALIGDVGGSEVVGNVLAGRGSTAIDTLRATDPTSLHISDNNIDNWSTWKGVGHFLRYHPMFLLWVFMFVVIGLTGLPGRMMSARWRPRARAAVQG